MFWLISGLIFYSIYHEEIVNKRIGFGTFTFLRFSRLYPLHLLTLLAVAVIQLFFLHTHHTHFVYQDNDLDHFFLQLFFMGSWFPDLEHSFNVPIWSVSIEIFVYIFFYLITLVGLTKGKRLIVIIFITLIFKFYGILPPFNTCLLFFFFGCLLAKLTQGGTPLQSLLLRYTLSFVVLFSAGRLLKVFFGEQLGSLNEGMLFTIKLIPLASALVLLFIIAFRSFTSKIVTSSLRNLGNMTYSLYLVHFPIQILLFLILKPEHYSFFSNPWMLIVFVAISMAFGWVVFRYFEMPVQKYLRSKYEQMTATKNVISTVSQQYNEVKGATQ